MRKREDSECGERQGKNVFVCGGGIVFVCVRVCAKVIQCLCVAVLIIIHEESLPVSLVCGKGKCPLCSLLFCLRRTCIELSGVGALLHPAPAYVPTHYLLAPPGPLSALIYTVSRLPLCYFGCSSLPILLY